MRSETSTKTGQCIAVVEDFVSDGDVLAAIAEAGYAGTVLVGAP